MLTIKSNSSSFNVKPLTTLTQKARGFMFRKKPSHDGFLFINNKETKTDLHMFFVFYSLDILYLDKKKRVIKRIRAYPFTYIKSPKAQYIIELLDAKTIKEGDTFTF